MKNSFQRSAVSIQQINEALFKPTILVDRKIFLKGFKLKAVR